MEASAPQAVSWVSEPGKAVQAGFTEPLWRDEGEGHTDHQSPASPVEPLHPFREKLRADGDPQGRREKDREAGAVFPEVSSSLGTRKFMQPHQVPLPSYIPPKYLSSVTPSKPRMQHSARGGSSQKPAMVP